MAGYFCKRRQRVKVGNSCSDFVSTTMEGPQGSVITLFAWLVYINDLSALVRDSGCGLFVDDVALWLASPSETSLVSRLNGELSRIYNWACLNRVLFDFKKFHLFDMGVVFQRSHGTVFVMG